METLVWIAALVVSLSAGAPAMAPGAGTVEGELLYPACTGLPADLQVCAENNETGAKFCTQKFFDQKGYRYRIELPAGKYSIFAQSDEARPGYRAYYSEAVRCGLRVGCDDHQPITVQVDAGRASRSIAPADWFVTENAKGVFAWNR